MQNEAVYRRIGTILLFLGPVTTLAVSPYSNFDPINLIKMIFVSASAFSVFALVLVSWRSSLERLPRGMWLAAGFFLFWMTLVVFSSGAPLNQQFWGVFGRNNGYLGYFSLVVILIAVALIQERRTYHKLVEVLVLTAIPMTLYAIIQVAGRDPIPWSVMAPFATLGNINFSSAFFGLASLCATVLAISPSQNTLMRLILIALAITDLWIILKTGSIQGFMIYIAGVGVAGFFLVRSIRPLQFLKIPYLFVGLIGFTLTVLSLGNLGPLARFVFGETILFRFDYWYAGWAMTVTNPFLGVGLDSYGDWYREVRGEIATLRTTPDRITNTAHNIYLDISASGGIPLLIAYLVLLGYGGVAAYRVFKRDSKFNPYFVALFSTWIAYLIQATISINQIGVGIWGWLFTGAIVGYEITTRDGSSNQNAKTIRRENLQLPASAALLAIAGLVCGFFLSFIPLNADAKFKGALQSGDANAQLTQAKALGATAQHMELALDGAIRANNEALTVEITRDLLDRYPRNFMGWRVRYLLASSTPKERQEAFETLRKLDPYNRTIQRTG
jgi:O-antigen ligase